MKNLLLWLLASLMFAAPESALAVTKRVHSHVSSNADLAASPAAAGTALIRDGYFTAGDAASQIYHASTAACSLNAGAGDNGSQVRSSDGKCWLATWHGNTVDPKQFGIVAATSGYRTITATAGNVGITVTGDTFTSANIGQYIVFDGGGPYEQRYIGTISAVGGANALTVSPAPSHSMSAFGTMTYYGPDNSAALNAAFMAGTTAAMGVRVPAGIYLAATPILCQVPDHNSQRLPAPICGGDPGATIKAVGNMSTSTPGAGTLLTVGTGVTVDYAHFLRNGFIDGGGLTLDCSFLCDYAFALPFSQEVRVQNFQTKNTLVAGFHIGLTGQPAIGAFFGDHNKVDRDPFYVPISNITCNGSHQPVVTTSIDHGIVTGRTATVVGANNLPAVGPISFLWESTGVRTGIVHNVACSASFTGAIAGTTLTVSALAAGALSLGSVVTGAGVTAGTVITALGTGLGGTGTYVVNNAQAIGAEAMTSAWPTFAGTANLALTMPTNAAPHPVFLVSTANPAQISIDGDLNLGNGDTWCIYGVGGTGPNGTTGAPTNVPDGCYVVSNVGGAGGDGPFHFTVPVNTAGFTFTGGGTAFRLYAAGGTIADMGFYLDNASDVQLSDNAIVGTRWPIYGSPVNSGFNGKYSHNHSSNLAEQGWIASGHVLGGSNSLIGEQVDTPAIFGATFSAGGNSSTGFGYNGSFAFVPDACCWIFRLDAGAAAADALSVTGTNGNGYSAGIRSSELSNHFTAGNPPYYGAIWNYTKFGGTNAGNLLYLLPDTRAGKSVFTGAPAGIPATLSTTAVAGGLGAAGCQITPRTNGGQIHFQIHGTIQNDTVGAGAFVQLAYGTVSGGVPASGAAFPGGTGVIGNAVGISGEPTGGGGMSVPYTVGGFATVTPNVTYYWDAAFRAVTGGHAFLGNSTCNAWED